MPEVAEWGLGGGGALQVYQLRERAGHGCCTLLVSSIDEEAAKLAKRNIDTSQRTNGDQVNTLMITDPDGNHIAFAQPIDQRLTR